MAEIRKLVKVFLASPGDLSDERKVAKSVVDEINNLFAEIYDCHVELIGWEDTQPGFGRPQAIINRDLERCELVVGMMWKRWGTPPDNSSQYTSGFEEEFSISLNRREKEGRPEISLLFKEIAQEFLIDPGDDLKKVLEFKKKIIEEKRILFGNFSTINEFEKKFRGCIANYLKTIHTKELEQVSDQSQTPTTKSESPQKPKPNSSAPQTPLSPEGAKFLREFITKTESDSNSDSKDESLAAVEIARFRLLSSLVGGQANDVRYLGTHDANLLYGERDNFTFGQVEINGLLACGLHHYINENTPLWYWLAKTGGFKNLSFFSILGPSTKQRVGALKAMSLISEPLRIDQTLKRKLYIKKWLDEGVNVDLKVAALGYLAHCGITEDLPAIREEFNRNDNQTISAAVNAILRISLRNDRQNILSILYDLQPVSISQDVISAIFDRPETFTSESLLNIVEHRSIEVRRIVVGLLCKRNDLSNEISIRLLGDSDAKVRYEALKLLKKNGRTFSDAEVKNILVLPSSPLGLNAVRGKPDTDSEGYWIDYQLEQLNSLNIKELELKANENIYDVFTRYAYFVLAERRFKRYAGDIRNMIDDQYEKEFSRIIQQWPKKLPEEEDLIKKVKDLEVFLRKKHARRALDIICRKGDQVDLDRVRASIKCGFVDYSELDIEYLREFGGWEDIQLIIDLLIRPEGGLAINFLASSEHNKKYQNAAQVIYALGKTRLDELLSISMPSQLLPFLINEIPEKVIWELSDKSIILLLQSTDEKVRKVAILKLIVALPKARLIKLLTDYVTGAESIYYNVVHWLDFGIAVPRKRTILAAKNTLADELD